MLAEGQTGEDGAREGNLHLCTDEKCWLVKQVSSSNSVYLTQTQTASSHRRPRGGNSGDDDHYDHDEMELDDAEGAQGIAAIAKPTSILELHAVEGDYDQIVTSHLSRLTPWIDDADDVCGVKAGHGIKELHEHIPAPISVVARVLARECVFEVTPSKSPNARACVPAPGMLLMTWERIVERATLADVAIAAGLRTDELLGPHEDDGGDESKHDTEAYSAVARRMFDRDGYFVHLGVITQSTHRDGQSTLNEMEMARWVGNLILRVHGQQGKSLKKDAFERMWEDAVPAAWVKYCSVEVLGSACEATADDEQDLVRWKPFVLRDGEASAGASSCNAAGKMKIPTAAGQDKKRKWHEKFAAQRNVKK